MGMYAEADMWRLKGYILHPAAVKRD